MLEVSREEMFNVPNCFLTWWKNRYQGANFCQDLETFPRKAWQKFAPWYLLFHMLVTLMEGFRGCTEVALGHFSIKKIKLN